MSERDEIKHNPFAVVTIGLFAITVIVGVAVNSYKWSNSDFRLPAYLDELERELNTVPVPDNTEALSPVQRSDKRVSMLVSRRYRSTLSVEELDHFYDENLARQGWRLAEKSRKVGGGRVAVYCKNDISGAVQVLEQKPNLVFVLDIFWPSGRECKPL